MSTLRDAYLAGGLLRDTFPWVLSFNCLDHFGLEFLHSLLYRHFCDYFMGME